CLDRETLDPAELQAHRLARRRGLDRGHERGLARRTAPALAAAALAAKVDVVDLDAPRQSLAGVTLHHHLLQLVLDLPCRGLGHAEPAAKLDAGDALLALGHVIHGPEPCPQRQLGRGEDRPGNRRGLPAAGGALEQVAALHQAVRAPTAGRTDEPVRPPRRDDDGPALWLGAVEAGEFGLAQAFLELHRIACHQRPPLETPCSWFVSCGGRLRKARNQEPLTAST